MQHGRGEIPRAKTSRFQQHRRSLRASAGAVASRQEGEGRGGRRPPVLLLVPPPAGPEELPCLQIKAGACSRKRGEGERRGGRGGTRRRGSAQEKAGAERMRRRRCLATAAPVGTAGAGTLRLCGGVKGDGDGLLLEAEENELRGSGRGKARRRRRADLRGRCRAEWRWRLGWGDAEKEGTSPGDARGWRGRCILQQPLQHPLEWLQCTFLSHFAASPAFAASAGDGLNRSGFSCLNCATHSKLHREPNCIATHPHNTHGGTR
jgi:hypothetical protein